VRPIKKKPHAAASAVWEHLTQLAERIDTGELKVFVKRTFPLSEVQAALQFQQSDKAPGKIVLTI